MRMTEYCAGCGAAVPVLQVADSLPLPTGFVITCRDAGHFVRYERLVRGTVTKLC